MSHRILTRHAKSGSKDKHLRGRERRFNSELISRLSALRKDSPKLIKASKLMELINELRNGKSKSGYLIASLLSEAIKNNSHRLIFTESRIKNNWDKLDNTPKSSSKIPTLKNNKKLTEESEHEIATNIIKGATEILSDLEEAKDWYNNQVLEAFENKTAKQFVAEGRGQDVLDYLKQLSPFPNHPPIFISDRERGEGEQIQESQIIESFCKLVGSREIAESWYFNQPIDAFKGKIPHQYALEGNKGSVLTYIEMLDDGVYV